MASSKVFTYTQDGLDDSESFQKKKSVLIAKGTTRQLNKRSPLLLICTGGEMGTPGSAKPLSSRFDSYPVLQLRNVNGKE